MTTPDKIETPTPRTDAHRQPFIDRPSFELDDVLEAYELAEQLEREIADAKEQARLGWERHAEKDAAYQRALNERDQWREVAGRLAEGLDAVLVHRGVDHEGNHSMWVGETAFLICKDCLAAYDALAKLSEKP